MKKFWKALGLTALAATVIPYRVRRDPEDVTHVDALLWQATRRSGEGEDKNQVDITFGFKSPLQELREERDLFTDDPEEAVLFADQADTTIGEAAADLAEAAAEKIGSELEGSDEPVVTEEDFDPEI